MGIKSHITYCNTVTVTGGIIYPPGVTLRQCNSVTGCYVTVTLARDCTCSLFRVLHNSGGGGVTS